MVTGPIILRLPTAPFRRMDILQGLSELHVQLVTTRQNLNESCPNDLGLLTHVIEFRIRDDPNAPWLERQRHQAICNAVLPLN
eukprot:Skav232305  [mRNA]  locus=scaffold882:549381:552464:+ [translate_table: standard]